MSTGSQKTTTEVKLSPQQKKLLNTATPILNNRVKNIPAIKGSSVAAFNDTQRNAQQGLLNSADQATQLARDFATNNAQAGQTFSNIAQSGEDVAKLATSPGATEFQNAAQQTGTQTINNLGQAGSQLGGAMDTLNRSGTNALDSGLSGLLNNSAGGATSIQALLAQLPGAGNNDNINALITGALGPGGAQSNLAQAGQAGAGATQNLAQTGNQLQDALARMAQAGQDGVYSGQSGLSAALGGLDSGQFNLQDILNTGSGALGSLGGIVDSSLDSGLGQSNSLLGNAGVGTTGLNTAAGSVSQGIGGLEGLIAQLQGTGLDSIISGSTRGDGALNQALGGTAAGRTGLEAAVSGVTGARNANEFLTSGALLNPDSNPVLQDQVKAAIRPLEESLMENILPQLRDEGVNSGMLGSSRQGLREGMAIRDYGKQVADISTNLQNNAFNNGLQALLGASNTGLQTGTNAANQLLRTGTEVGEGLQERGLQAGQSQLTAGTSAAQNLTGAGLDASGNLLQSGQSAGENLTQAGLQAGATTGQAGTSAGTNLVGAGTDAANSLFQGGLNAGNSVLDTTSSAASNVANNALGANSDIFQQGSQLSQFLSSQGIDVAQFMASLGGQADSTLAGTGANLVGQNAGLAAGANSDASSLAAALQGQNLEAGTSVINNSADNLLRSLFATPDVIQAQSYGDLLANSVGGDLQQQSQARITDAREREIYNKNRKFNAALQIAQTALGLPGASTVSSASGAGAGSNIGSLLGTGAGLFLGGPAGAMVGGGLGRTLGNLF